MHELGVLLEVVKQVTEVAAQNNVEKVEKLVLQVGELSSMIPKYIKDIYPMAVEDTVLEGSVLEVETIPGNGKCRGCTEVFNLMIEKGVCPRCGKRDFEIISGDEFFIKEIQVYEE